jgi:competence protein ComEC
MTLKFQIPVWKTAPFLRLVLPLMAGVIVQWYLKMPFLGIVWVILSFTLAYFLFYFLPLSLKFTIQPLQGFLLNCILLSFGLLITWNKEIRHTKDWYGNYYADSDYVVVTVSEPLAEKNKSYKADCYVEGIVNNGAFIPCKGKLLLYFSKDSGVNQLRYGDQLLFNKTLQQVKNSGNPGAFNYQQYAAFQQIFHTAFLKKQDWVLLKRSNINPFKAFIFSARQKVINVLRKNLDAQKDALGIAEALLIGYTNDLDKDLVQAYSNTGVVHIIAISGMHLGLIYVMLSWLFAKIPFIKKSKWLQAVLILSCLWLFSLLTGGSASVLRSAVMFSFITIGKTVFSKQVSIYNSLAASCFTLLVYNPYYLWDVGFQLSYLAVLSIVIFQKPIYNLWHVKNKWADKVWQMIAITIAAQILTFPACIYYFHQFPNLFLLTNLIVIPLSTIILFAEIVLVAFAWIPFLGVYMGRLTGWLVELMNKIILWVSKFSFSVWDRIPSTILSTWLLYATVVALCAWLMYKNKKVLQLCLIALLTFIIVRAYSSWKVKNQQKLIVYNVPQYQAIDFVLGNGYTFFGDSILTADGTLQNFHLKPGRVTMQLNKKTDSLPGYFNKAPFYKFCNKTILIIDKPLFFEAKPEKVTVDLIILCKSSALNITQLAAVFNCRQYVADASNSLWKIGKWKKECEELHLQFHSVPEKGAFVLDL